MSMFIDALPINNKLIPYINSYRFISGSKAIHCKDLLPRAGATMILDVDGMRFNKCLKLQQSLIGLHTKPIVCQTLTSERKCMVIKLNSWGLSRFVNGPIDLYTNRVIDLKEMFGMGLNDLLDGMNQELTLLDSIKLAENILLKHFQEPSGIEKKIFDLAGMLSVGNSPIHDCIKEIDLSLSSRQIERRFKSLIGLSMRAYVKLCRFERSYLLLSNPEQHPLSKIGLYAGYYDQPHFSKTFKQLAFLAPQEFNPCQNIPLSD